jgi:methylenetetrahydrofolate reductase (NADPH)
MLELSGEDLPSDLAIELEVEPTDEGRREIGIDWAARLGRRLLDGGAPGLHLYTFNQHEAVLSMLDRIGVLPDGGAEHTHTPTKSATEKEPA